MAQYQSQLGTIFSSLSQENLEAAIKYYLKQTATLTNHSKLKCLLGLLEKLVGNNVLPPR